MIEKEDIVNPPHVVVGHSLINPQFTVSLRINELYDILACGKPGDVLEITLYYHSSPKFSIIKKKE